MMKTKSSPETRWKQDSVKYIWTSVVCSWLFLPSQSCEWSNGQKVLWIKTDFRRWCWHTNMISSSFSPFSPSWRKNWRFRTPAGFTTCTACPASWAPLWERSPLLWQPETFMETGKHFHLCCRSHKLLVPVTLSWVRSVGKNKMTWHQAVN